ncbi:uncharacterized protein FA14DRAFT_79545 [Meira miltonrushii]|uniref:DUF3752 domain-containing protein n=1 Tax=Meira miltonrushii TaxID=1280837 RepID=A0A316VBK3_9BASI|nr:uncharacterized protein FA14DRAFT_79545 [Meira miltonrushii]PWN32935.1 hypothetical protein FA14DRAFT_79545 [Meira miltonrushii]
MIGPSLPDQASDGNGQQSAASTSRRVMGPMLPDSSQQSQTSGGMSSAAKEFIDRQERIRLTNEHGQSDSGSTSKQPEQRPDWMLAPPSATGISDMFNKDPTAALKARGFNQSGNMRVQRTATMPTNPDDIDSASWTETPQERAKRLYEEQMGIRNVNGSGSNSHLESQQLEDDRRREERVKQAVQEHQASRGPSLLEQHQAKRRKELRDKDSKSDRDDRHRRQHHSRRNRTSDDEESRSSRHRRHRRERSQSVSDDGESHSRSRDKHRENDRSSRHGVDRHDRHGSRHHSKHSSSRRSHRSRSPSAERGSERSRASKREDKEVRREKERKKTRRDEEEREEKRGAPTMIWDREAALSVGGQLMDERKRTDFIKSSATLSDRFGQGSSRYM